MVSTRPRRKSKNNPGGLCKVCGDNIFNRTRHALVCINCSKKFDWLWPKIGSIRTAFNKRFPGYKLIVKYKVKKND